MVETILTTFISLPMASDRRLPTDAGLWGIVKWKNVRDISMFTTGLGGFAHEVIAKGPERPTLLLACLALMGVPFMIRKDKGGDDE